jgi:hypothetical protein
MTAQVCQAALYLRCCLLDSRRYPRKPQVSRPVTRRARWSRSLSRDSILPSAFLRAPGRGGLWRRSGLR